MICGDQTIWMVYNNADSSARPAEWDRSSPFPHAALEIHQLAYAHKSTYCDSAALLANVIFFEWTIINKEPTTIDSAYAVFWTDIDFHDLNNPGVDTLRQLPYCWESESFHIWGPLNMAVGFVLLHGPIIPSAGDTALFRGTKRAGHRNLPMTSFWPVNDDSGPDSGSYFYTARKVGRLWNIARGYNKDGLPLLNPTTGQPTKYPYGGDPVTGTGWMWQKSDGRGGGAGFYSFFGPFTMAPGDTQWIHAALVPARGKDNLDAIQVLRSHAETLRGMSYDELLNSEFDHIICEEPFVPASTQLLQNYPNPFNAGTVITFDVDRSTNVRVTVYDLLGRQVAVLTDAPRAPGRYSVELTGKGMASGVYVYRMEAGSYVETKKLLLVR
jgi:hypothetical protein